MTPRDREHRPSRSRDAGKPWRIPANSLGIRSMKRRTSLPGSPAERVIGYSIHAGDNDSFYYEFGEGVPACPACGLVTRLDWLNPTFLLERTGFDVSFTWDLAPTVSERFVTFVSAYPGARFLPLPAAPGFSLFILDPIVPFDAERRGTKLMDPCSGCARFTQIAGADPVYLKPGPVLPKGFSRTDIEFGSARERPDRATAQSPQFLVDPELGEALASQALRGLRLEPIRE